MPLDHYLSLGRSGLAVSPLCLGTMGFCDPDGIGMDGNTAKLVFGRYVDLGGNFVDTSNVYGHGKSESLIGEVIGNASEMRQKLVIATKFSANLDSGNPNGGGAGRKAIIHACEQSLRRLQTDYIDLYWQHWEDPFVPVEETMRALDALVTSGKVRYIGFSDTSAWVTAKAQLLCAFRGWNPLIAIQFEYSLLERTAEAELIPMARDQGLGITPWGPLRGGLLSGKYDRNNQVPESPGRARWMERDANERFFALIDVMKDIAHDHATSAARVALAWLRSRNGVVAPIIGPRKIAQLEDNVASLDLVLSPQDIARLDALSTPELAFPAGFLPLAHRLSYAGVNVNTLQNKAHAAASASPRQDTQS